MKEPTAAEQRDFLEIQSLAKDMLKADADRDAMFADLTDIYQMNWDGPADTRIKALVAPDCHNTIQGMVDLLVGVRPNIKIPVQPGSKNSEELASRIEKTLALVRRRFNRLRGSDVEEEAAFTGALFGMMAIKLVYVPDTVEALQAQARKHDLEADERTQLKKQVKFYQGLAKKTPFLVDVLNPTAIHSQRGADGLRRVLECHERTVADVRAEWGEYLLGNMQPTTKIVYQEYWDRYRYCKWVDDELLDIGEHDLPFIPYVIQDTNSTRIFGRTQYYPVLYSVWQGGLWKALNLVLTLTNSNVFALGNPQWVCVGDSAHKADIHFDMAGGRIDLDEGDSIYPLAKDINTTDVQAMYATLRQLVEESTMNKMIFGKPPERILAFSTVNMLVQGARHTLMPLISGLGDGLGELFEKALQWVVFRHDTLELYGEGEMVTLKPSDIDLEHIEVLVELKPDIPQDRLQLLNMAKMAVDTGLSSRYTARDLAGWMQPDEEEERIVKEQLTNLFLQTKMQELSQATQPEQQPEQQLPPGMPDETGYTQTQAGLPQVQNTGEPTPEFTQSAAENMENLG